MMNHVRGRRREINMTQQKLADAINVSRQTISLIEKGEYNPSLKLCIALCIELDQTLDELFWLEEEIKK